jgi:hypothetical protein
MERGWSAPVAQALQRHTGSWQLSSSPEIAPLPACNTSESPSVKAVANASPAAVGLSGGIEHPAS